MQSWSLSLLLACLAVTKAARLGDLLTDSSRQARDLP